MISLRQFQEKWCSDLKALYDERETKTMLQFALEDCLNWQKPSLLADAERELTANEEAAMNALLTDLLTGKPYQYCVGFTYFCDLKIAVSSAVLIPRPETEELVYWIVESVGKSFAGTIEDWCTGSGCIALGLKKELPKASVHGMDVSEEAMQQARINGTNLNLEIDWKTDNALNESRGEDKIDVLVSNPPYIPIREKAEMNSNVTEFEPDLALFVPNDDALLFYRKLAEQARKRLNPGGMLFFELHEKYANETAELVRSLGFQQVEIKQDLQGKNRMLRATGNSK